MITRIWHGQTSIADAEKYLSFLLTRGTGEYRSTTGNLSARVWNLNGKTIADFWTVTEWETLEAIKAFAGDDYTLAKYYPEDQGILIDFEKNVLHYDSYNVSNTRIKDYIKQLKQLYNGGSWQGESFKEKLKPINEKKAFARPLPDIHSVAELVWHCIYWRTTLIKNMQGEKGYRDATVDQLNFLPLDELQSKGWKNLRNELEQSQQILIELLSVQTDSFLLTEFKKDHLFESLVEGIIHHDIYHLGQLGIVIKMLN
jgi:hypothetical protein